MTLRSSVESCARHMDPSGFVSTCSSSRYLPASTRPWETPLRAGPPSLRPIRRGRPTLPGTHARPRAPAHAGSSRCRFHSDSAGCAADARSVDAARRASARRPASGAVRAAPRGRRRGPATPDERQERLLQLGHPQQPEHRDVHAERAPGRRRRSRSSPPSCRRPRRRGSRPTTATRRRRRRAAATTSRTCVRQHPRPVDATRGGGAGGRRRARRRACSRPPSRCRRRRRSTPGRAATARAGCPIDHVTTIGTCTRNGVFASSNA